MCKAVRSLVFGSRQLREATIATFSVVSGTRVVSWIIPSRTTVKIPIRLGWNGLQERKNVGMLRMAWQ